MKSLIKICFIIFMCSLSSQLKLKKSETMMEFYNSLFNKNWAMSGSESKSNSELQNLKIKNKSKSHNRVSSESENLYKSKYKSAKFNNHEDAQNKTESDAPLFNGYLKISSKLFKIPSLFPPIRIINEDGVEQTMEIFVDKDEFRINQTPLAATNSTLDDRDFYFTLTKTHFFYTVNDKDVNVLQTFAISDYKISELPAEWQLDGTAYNCFELKQRMTNYNYKICGKDKTTVSKAMCDIADLIPYEINSCHLNEIAGINEEQVAKIPPTTITETIEEATILVPLPSKICNDNWNYENHGDDWECQCKDGMMQSPIDLPDPKEAILSPVTPLFQFDEVNAKNTITTIDGEIKANEYIKMKYSDGALRIMHHNLGKIVTLNGAVYIAEEITVHTPSEHTIKGKRLDMEIQITFYGQSKGDIAKQVVLSFLFEKKAGYYNKFLDDLDFYNLPNQYFKEKEILNNIFIPKILYSVNGDSPDDLPVMKPFSFYTYDGSLTMPPCSEDTIHYVASEPIPVGSVVLDLAKEALKMADMEEVNSETGEKRRIQDLNTYENHRNTQNLNNRGVFYFDHKRYCGSSINNIIPQKRKEKGHYERVKRKVSEYIYVPGKDPSHIPGAFVVSENESRGYSENV